MALGVDRTGFYILAALTGHVTLGRMLKYSEPWFPHSVAVSPPGTLTTLITRG